jgi:alpha-tubulin suppressor-like RCC1 family protein
MRKFILGLISVFMFISMITWQKPTKAVEETLLQSNSIRYDLVEAGASSSFYLDEYDGLWAWGWNGWGQLGDGTTTDKLTPVKVLENVASISAGVYHNLAIKTDGSLWAWGANYFGQLGDGTLVGQTSPIKVMENVVFANAGWDTSFIIKTDGSLWAWGRNAAGQLGDGTTINKSSPVKIMDDVVLVESALGGSHTLAIKSDSSLWAWGNNYYGQLGDGTTIDKFTPTKITDSVIRVAVGQSHALAIKSDSSLWAWGWNGYGQLGDGTDIAKTSPVKIMDNVANISASDHSLAIKNDGTLWAWGRNVYGTIGDGSKLNRLLPVEILANTLFVTAGWSHTIALQNDGTLWGWGSNSNGQLGNNSTIDSLLPMEIDVPIINIYGISQNAIYNDNRIITFDRGNALLNGIAFISGTTVSEEGSYVLIVTDDLGNTTTVSFVIDKTAPVITIGSYSTLPTNQDVTVTASTNEGTLNATSHTFNENGSFTFIAADEAGNISEKTVTISHIDKIAPVISGVVDGSYYNISVKPTFNEGVAMLNGNPFVSSTLIEAESSYVLSVTDDAGNTTSVSFVLDMTQPFITIIEFSTLPTNQDVTVAASTNEGTLNKTSHTFTENGSFTFIATDLAGNVSEKTVTISHIDKTPPVITATPYSTETTHLPVTVYVTTDEGTLNAESHTFNENGSFTFIATDLAGNVTEKTVTITHIVSPTQVKTISISQLPTKLNYIQGVELDPTGGQISVITYEGSLSTLPLTLDMFSGYDPYSSAYGPQTVTVTYQGVTTTFEVYLNRFIDVPYGHRNYTHINALVGLGIINGYSDNTFRPSNTLTRAQAAIMIVRAAGISTEGVSSNFTDVPPTHAAYKFISAAYQAGIINGYSDGTFRPNANVTRAQIAIMVQRAFNVQASETIITFTDVPEGYAPKKFIEILASQKIVNGYSDGTFKPLNNVTRAQFSTMIYNAILYVNGFMD